MEARFSRLARRKKKGDKKGSQGGLTGRLGTPCDSWGESQEWGLDYIRCGAGG